VVHDSDVYARCITVSYKRSLSVFQLYGFSSGAFAIFLEYSRRISCDFVLSFVFSGYYLWSNALAKTKKTNGESLVASFYSVWKSKKDLEGQSNNTNSEFVEFLLHRVFSS